MNSNKLDDSSMRQVSTITVLPPQQESLIQLAFNNIQDKHKKVSKIKTPPLFVKQKNVGGGKSFDYVEHKWMKRVADEQYPGWSWTIVKYTIEKDKVGKPVFVAVHGRLNWYEYGLWRQGDMIAGHRIQYLKDSAGLSDPGNDIKAANTDCMKKALNVYLNIADDVYKNEIEDWELDERDIEYILTMAEVLGKEEKKKFEKMIENQTINAGNAEGTIIKLKRLSRDEGFRFPDAWEEEIETRNKNKE